MDDIDRIIAGLSEAQRKLLVGDFTNGPLRNRAFAQIRSHLIRKGIWADIGFTPLGLAVRARLLQGTE